MKTVAILYELRKDMVSRKWSGENVTKGWSVTILPHPPKGSNIRSLSRFLLMCLPLQYFGEKLSLNKAVSPAYYPLKHTCLLSNIHQLKNKINGGVNIICIILQGLSYGNQVLVNDMKTVCQRTIILLLLLSCYGIN